MKKRRSFLHALFSATKKWMRARPENEDVQDEKLSAQPCPAPSVTDAADGEAPAPQGVECAAPSADMGDGEMATTLLTADGRRIIVKYRHSFRSRIIQADEESKAYYADMKNYLMSYEKIGASDSQNYESFSVGRQQIAKLNLSGKTLILYLALDPQKLDGSKYKFENAGDRKRFEKTPLKIKIRSARSQKWAKELIDMAMLENGIPQGETKNESYAMPYEDKATLVARGLIQVTAQDAQSGAKIDEAIVLSLLAAGMGAKG